MRKKENWKEIGEKGEKSRTTVRKANQIKLVAKSTEDKAKEDEWMTQYALKRNRQTAKKLNLMEKEKSPMEGSKPTEKETQLMEDEAKKQEIL